MISQEPETETEIVAECVERAGASRAGMRRIYDFIWRAFGGRPGQTEIEYTFPVCERPQLHFPPLSSMLSPHACRGLQRRHGSIALKVPGASIDMRGYTSKISVLQFSQDYTLH